MLRWTCWIYLSFPNRWWWNWCEIHLAAYPLVSVFWSSASRPCRWRLVTLHELGDRLETSPSHSQPCSRSSTRLFSPCASPTSVSWSFPKSPCCCFQAFLWFILGAGFGAEWRWYKVAPPFWDIALSIQSSMRFRLPKCDAFFRCLGKMDPIDGVMSAFPLSLVSSHQRSRRVKNTVCRPSRLSFLPAKKVPPPRVTSNWLNTFGEIRTVSNWQELRHDPSPLVRSSLPQCVLEQLDCAKKCCKNSGNFQIVSCCFPSRCDWSNLYQWKYFFLASWTQTSAFWRVTLQCIAPSASLSRRFSRRTNFPTNFEIWCPKSYLWLYSFAVMSFHFLSLTRMWSSDELHWDLDWIVGCSASAECMFSACFPNRLLQSLLEKILDPCILTHPRSGLSLGIWIPNHWCYLQM